MCADQYWFMGDQMGGADVAIKWGICTWCTKFGGAMMPEYSQRPRAVQGERAYGAGDGLVYQISL